MQFYSKANPKQKLYCSTGNWLQFEVAGDDVGVLATDNPSIIQELRAAMQRQIGGIEEITHEQYQALKKNGTFKRPWREELSSNSAAQVLPRPSPSSVQAVLEDAGLADVKENLWTPPVVSPAARPVAARKP